MTLIKIDYIPPTGIEEYDQQVINHFNKIAQNINDMNFTTDREEAEQAGATDYLEVLDSLENKRHEVIKARARFIEHVEIIKKRSNNPTTATQHDTNDTSTIRDNATRERQPESSDMTKMTTNITKMTRQQGNDKPESQTRIKRQGDDKPESSGMTNQNQAA